jgi:hypothetical protein
VHGRRLRDTAFLVRDGDHPGHRWSLLSGPRRGECPGTVAG